MSGIQREEWTLGADRRLVLDQYGRDSFDIPGPLLRELLTAAGWQCAEKKREAGQ